MDEKLEEARKIVHYFQHYTAPNNALESEVLDEFDAWVNRVDDKMGSTA